MRSDFMAPQKDISTIVHATRILKCLSKNIGSITHLSKELNLNKATVHRTLQTLASTGFVVQDPLDRCYHLGPMIQKLTSNPFLSHQDLILTAHSYLEHLRDFSTETSGLQIRSGTKRMVLEEIPSHHPIKFYTAKGFVGPLYTGAAGKVLLAELNTKDLHILLDNMQLVPVGPKTITDKDLLFKELEMVRKQGFAVSVDETVDGATAMAVPIKNYFCPVALGLVGPTNRFLKKKNPCIKELKQIALKISNEINNNIIDNKK